MLVAGGQAIIESTGKYKQLALVKSKYLRSVCSTASPQSAASPETAYPPDSLFVFDFNLTMLRGQLTPTSYSFRSLIGSTISFRSDVTRECGGISPFTTVPAPITQPSPMCVARRITAFAPIQQLSPIVIGLVL